MGEVKRFKVKFYAQNNDLKRYTNIWTLLELTTDCLSPDPSLIAGKAAVTFRCRQESRGTRKENLPPCESPPAFLIML